ncbi:hypothetical protein SLA2020_144100 [Shorea laevis]
MTSLLTTSDSLVLAGLLLLFSLPLYLTLKRGRKLNLPPSPPKLPIIGNLHQLGKLPHRSLLALSRKYGPLMLLHIGQSPTLVVSSAEMAREIMKNHDVVFSSRPNSMAAEILLYGRTDIGFAPYGEYWRQLRKICVLELLNIKRVQSFQFVREEEVTVLIDKLRSASLEGSSINLSEMISVVTNNIITRCVFSRRAEKEDSRISKLTKLTRQVSSLLSSPSFGDVAPLLGWLDYLTGFVSRLRETSRELSVFFDRVIEERTQCGNNDGSKSDRLDLLQILLQLQKGDTLDMDLTKDNIKGILMDVFVGGTDTSWATTEWVMAELVKNPSIMKKAQEEVRNVVGEKSKLDENDIYQMSYLKCVIKEGLRLHAPAPLLLPRETAASDKLAGFDIPPKTRVLINAWAIHRDPNYWDRPEEFLPERFEDCPVDFKDQDFKFFPFGGGRRACPGMPFAMAVVECIVANLLCWFDWKFPGGETEKLDMDEAFGLTTGKKSPLHLVPILHFP